MSDENFLEQRHMTFFSVYQKSLKATPFLKRVRRFSLVGAFFVLVIGVYLAYHFYLMNQAVPRPMNDMANTSDALVSSAMFLVCVFGAFYGFASLLGHAFNPDALTVPDASLARIAESRNIPDDIKRKVTTIFRNNGAVLFGDLRKIDDRHETHTRTT